MTLVVVVATSRALRLLPLILLLLVATGEAATFNITNRCSYTVWPAAVPVGGGMQLNPGQTWTLNVPNNTRGRIWARTGCSFDGKGRGNGSCQTGDCGGLLACKGYGQPPNTLAEFTLNMSIIHYVRDYFDISLVDGFNVPMDFLPAPQGQGEQGCSKGPRCAGNIMSQCPSKLKAPGGCNSACTVFKEDKYCCPRTGAQPCPPTNYSLIFSRSCPDAYTYPKDDKNKAFSCPSGTNYQVVFCPPIDLEVAPSPAGYQPAPPVVIAPSPAALVQISDTTPPSPSPASAPSPTSPAPSPTSPASASAPSPPPPSPASASAPSPPRPTSERSSARSKVVVILAPLAGFISLVILFSIIFFLSKRRIRRRQEMEQDMEDLKNKKK